MEKLEPKTHEDEEIKKVFGVHHREKSSSGVTSPRSDAGGHGQKSRTVKMAPAVALFN